MKLYIKNNDGKRVYLNKVASTRRELVSVIGSENFKVKNARYSVRDVVAIRDSNDTYKGSLIGGAVGIFAGPAGVIAGGVVGGVLGKANDTRRKKNVVNFNESKYLIKDEEKA